MELADVENREHVGWQDVNWKLAEGQLPYSLPAAGSIFINRTGKNPAFRSF
jgi:hypothetical protein